MVLKNTVYGVNHSHRFGSSYICYLFLVILCFKINKGDTQLNRRCERSKFPWYEVDESYYFYTKSLRTVPKCSATYDELSNRNHVDIKCACISGVTSSEKARVGSNVCSKI